jgi:hypothetical protein
MAKKRTFAFTGNVSIVGAVTMLIGAACWGASGTDLWQALAGNQMDTYMSQLPDVKRLLAVNTFFWSLGALLMATALTLMAKLCISNLELAQMAKVFSMAGVSIAIVSFIIMLSPAIITPSVEIATIIGWIGVRLDDIATMLIVGFSPLCLSIAGKADWIPGWLSVWGFLAQKGLFQPEGYFSDTP